MRDINNVIIFLLLIGLIYVLYKYKYITIDKFTPTLNLRGYSSGKTDMKTITSAKQKQKQRHRTNANRHVNDNKRITVDNVSQISLESLENEDGNANYNNSYKQDSILGSLISNNTNASNKHAHNDLGSLLDANTHISEKTDDSFFF